MVEPAVSVYAFMESWLTHSFLFILINLVIGTIVIISRFTTLRGRVDSPQLVRSPSLLHRVISSNLGYHKYEPPTTTLAETQRVDGETVLQNHYPPRLDRAPSFNLGLYKTESRETSCPNQDDPTQMQKTRTPSFLERVMSVKFYRSESIEAEKKEPGPGPGPGPESDIGGNESGLGYLRGGEEEGVDEKADDFIKRFKQQLRLQRLDSILRYRDMLIGN